VDLEKQMESAQDSKQRFSHFALNTQTLHINKVETGNKKIAAL
jgi:hypothetical protein